jgi:DtxR family Mn-dependent transcriptional regulator
MKILSAAVEDYLKAIHELQEGDPHSRVSTSALAERLGVASASVTGMLQKLDQLEPQLVDYRRYRGVTLTEAGEKIAREVLRHHRLIETYLMEALGFRWDEVHQEADELEHVISESLEAKIAEFLGHPETDPHGDPIPDLDGELAPTKAVPLSELGVGERGRIRRVVDEPELLRYLDSIELGLDTQVEVTSRGPFEDVLNVRVVGHSEIQALSRKVAEQLFVEKERGSERSRQHAE